MQKPSILFINRVYPPAKGATGRLLHDLAKALVEIGWEVSVLTTGQRNEKRQLDGVSVHQVKASDTKTVFGYSAIWMKLFLRAAKFPKPSLVVTMTDPPLLAVAGKFLAKRWAVPHINWCQDLYPDILPSLSVNFPAVIQNFLKKISRRTLKSCDRVIVIGRCMAKYLTQTGMDTRRMSVIPNWVDAEFHSDMQRPDYAKPQKPLLTDTARKFRVLYAGNMGRAHPLDTILEAAAMLQSSNPEIEFIFVGHGIGHDYVAQERNKRSLENIRLLPWQPNFQLREMMQGGDVHLISMDMNSLGMLVPCKVYSAIASERPAIFIGPAECEAARILQEYQAGSVVSQGDARFLADEIIGYRMDGQKWFNAHKGAAQASLDLAPRASINRWIEIVKTTTGISNI